METRRNARIHDEALGLGSRCSLGTQYWSPCFYHCKLLSGRFNSSSFFQFQRMEPSSFGLKMRIVPLGVASIFPSFLMLFGGWVGPLLEIFWPFLEEITRLHCGRKVSIRNGRYRLFLKMLKFVVHFVRWWKWKSSSTINLTFKTLNWLRQEKLGE